MQLLNSTEAPSLIIDWEFDEYAQPPVEWHDIQQPYMPTVDKNEDSASEILMSWQQIIDFQFTDLSRVEGEGL